MELATLIGGYSDYDNACNVHLCIIKDPCPFDGTFCTIDLF